MASSIEKNTKTIKMLLETGNDVNHTRNGMSALDIALRIENNETAIALLRQYKTKK